MSGRVVEQDAAGALCDVGGGKAHHLRVRPAEQRRKLVLRNLSAHGRVELLARCFKFDVSIQELSFEFRCVVRFPLKVSLQLRERSIFQVEIAFQHRDFRRLFGDGGLQLLNLGNPV